MAILAFQKPDKVVLIESDGFHGKFEFRPLEPGYGITVGNVFTALIDGVSAEADFWEGTFDCEYTLKPSSVSSVSTLLNRYLF